MTADLFYIVLFVTTFGSIAWICVMLLQHVLKLKVPFSLCSIMMGFYLILFFNPKLKLIAENQNWIYPFQVSSGIWAAGLGVFACSFVIRYVHAALIVRNYESCREKSVGSILRNCAVHVGLKRLPEILYGNLKDPACTILIGHPKIILSKRIADQLTKQELAVILTHELIHIKRGHLLLQNCFNLIVCIHWFNPIVWLARHEFSVSCEMDCDRNVFKSMPELSASAYANLMLKMLELALPNKQDAANAMGTLDFVLARQRFQSILVPDSAVKKCCSMILSLGIVAAVLCGSLSGSKSYFNSSSVENAGNVQIERSADHESH